MENPVGPKNKDDGPEKNSHSFTVILSRYDKYIMFVLFIILSALLSDKFFTTINLTNILKQNAAIGIIAIGELLVILTGGIDLSVGSQVALTGIIAALFLKGGMNWPLVCFITLLFGIFFGFLNGFLVTIGRITPFIVTLGTLTAYQGIGLVLSKGRQVFFENENFLILGGGSLGVIPFVALIWLAVCIVGQVFLEKSVPGRFIRGIGGNKEAVRLAGINSILFETLAYIISGFLCAISGILMTSRLTLGTNVVGQGWELIAIASVMVGGGSFVGGLGSIGGTVIGVMILGLIGNIMNLLGITVYWQQVIRGIIILLAVFSSSRKRYF